MKKILVLTANIGGFDVSKSFPNQNMKCDFMYFTERNLPRPMTALNDRMKAKYFKIQTHKLFPDYDYYIWMDSSFQIKSPNFVQMMLNAIEGFDIAMTKHPERNCIYTETEFVLQGMIKGSQYLRNRYAGSKLNLERNYYQTIGYPENNGLFACGLFIRENCKETNEFFDSWWDSCLQWSYFDQISFPVLAHLHEAKVNPLVFNQYLNNEFYQLIKHQKNE